MILATKIWQEYCQFLMNNIESPSDIDRARETFERAITAVGLHVTEVNKVDLAFFQIKLDKGGTVRDCLQILLLIFS